MLTVREEGVSEDYLPMWEHEDYFVLASTEAASGPIALLDALTDRPCAPGKAVPDSCVKLTQTPA